MLAVRQVQHHSHAAAYSGNDEKGHSLCGFAAHKDDKATDQTQHGQYGKAEKRE